MASQSRKRASEKSYPRLQGDYLTYREGRNLVSVRTDSLFIELLPPKIKKWLKAKRLKVKKFQKK